jgi:hypothetical protein
MCPPRSDNGSPQGQHALVDAVIGRSRDVPGSLPTARKPVHPPAPDFPSQCVGDGFGGPAPNAETVVAEGIDQLGDSRRPLLCQVQGEHITEFDSSETEAIHRRTVTRLSDIDGIVAARRANWTPLLAGARGAGERLRTGPVDTTSRDTGGTG